MCHFDVKSYTPCRSVHALHSRLLCGLTLELYNTYTHSTLDWNLGAVWDVLYVYTVWSTGH